MTINRTRLLRWLRQPTTVAGLAALAGDALMTAVGAATWRVELPLAFGSLVAIVLPDDSATTALSVRTLREVLAAVASHDPKAIEAAVADGEALLQAVSHTV